MDHLHHPHPVLGCAAAIDAALKDVIDVDPSFMRTRDKREALLRLTELAGRVAELRLRVLASAADVAEEVGARDQAAWLSHAARLDRGDCRRDLRLGQALDARWQRLAAGLRDGAVNPAQAEVVARALDDLPDDVDADVQRLAEGRLVAEAARFRPRQLRILGRRVLDVVAPEVADEQERRALEREEAAAARETWLTTRRRGDGTTDLRGRVADAVADRLLTYLEAFASPRRAGVSGQAHDRRPYGRRLGDALRAFLETVDPRRMPLHGGDATSVVVTLDLQTLLTGVGVALVGDQPISAGEARRLACSASIVPAVLGGSPRCSTSAAPAGCSRPPSAERWPCATDGVVPRAATSPPRGARPTTPVSPGPAAALTDLGDGVLLCSWHHHRAHDHHYDQRRLPDGDVRFSRRT